MKYIFSIFIFSFIIIGCEFSTPKVYHGQFREAKETEYCIKAEAHLKSINCEEGNDLKTINPKTKQSYTFTEFCEEEQDKGNVFLNPKCLSEILTCQDIDECLNPPEDGGVK